MMDKEQFQEWKGHPLTVEFLNYLKDNQMLLMEQWGSGMAMDPWAQPKALLMGDLSSPDWNSYATFYKNFAEWRRFLAERQADQELPASDDA